MAAESCFLSGNEDVFRQYGCCSGPLDQLQSIGDYSAHYKTTHGFAFAVQDVDSMLDVILSRVGIFDSETFEMENAFICNHHYLSLGPQWEPKSRIVKGHQKCQLVSRHSDIPSATTPDEETEELKTQATGIAKLRQVPRGDRRISKMQSEAIYREESILLPVGSPICSRCQDHCNKVFGAHYKVHRMV